MPYDYQEKHSPAEHWKRNVKPNKITIHCSATKDGDDCPAATIRKWHVEGNGWKDIGYHLVIQPTGQVENGRPMTKQGAHAGAGNNQGNIGICMVGTDKFTFAAFQALRYNVEAIQQIYDIQTYEIYGHYEFNKHKTCPNMRMSALIYWLCTCDLNALRPYLLCKTSLLD